MSSRKTSTSTKSSEIVERRISQLFKNLREESGNVRINNNEELAQDRRGNHPNLQHNLSHVFSDAFADPSSIPSPEPVLTQETISPSESTFSIIKGYTVHGETIQATQLLDEGIRNWQSFSSQIVISTGIGSDPETITIRIPTVNPITKQKLYIHCDVTRPLNNKAWDESDLARLKNILVHLEDLLQQHPF